MALAEVTPVRDIGEVGFQADVEEALRRLEAAVDEARGALDSLDGLQLGEVAQRVVELRPQVEALELEALARYRDSLDWAADGYKSPNAWLRAVCRLPKAAAGKRLALARKLKAMPATAASFAAGRITIDHVDRLGKAATARPEHFADAEALLVGNAERLQFADFAKTVARFEELTDPEPDPDPDPTKPKRKLHSSRLLDGMGRVDGWLDKVGFSTFDNELRRLEQQLFDEDWAAAKAEHGDDVSVDKLARTPEQRRADALVLMAERSASTPSDAKPPKPLVVVHIDWDTFTRALDDEFDIPVDPLDPTAPVLSELADGTPISPTLAIKLALRGHVRRLVLDTPKVKLEYGRKARLATGVLRELIQVRDRHCTGPGCDTPATQCEVDHVTEWQDDGQTNACDLDCKCRWHHRWKHRFHITRDPATGHTAWHRSTRPPPVS